MNKFLILSLLMTLSAVVLPKANAEECVNVRMSRCYRFPKNFNLDEYVTHLGFASSTFEHRKSTTTQYIISQTTPIYFTIEETYLNSCTGTTRPVVDGTLYDPAGLPVRELIGSSSVDETTLRQDASATITKEFNNNWNGACKN